jgi:hypothetical protein
MHDEIDYLALERKDQPPGSFNAAVKDLIVKLRYMREGIPATEIKEHMPEARELEKKLHHFDDLFNQEHREYLSEIWEVLENEPEPDDSKSFQVFELSINVDSQATLTNTYESFPQHIIAEEWIKGSGDRGTKYVILEVIEP